MPDQDSKRVGVDGNKVSLEELRDLSQAIEEADRRLESLQSIYEKLFGERYFVIR